MSYKKISLQIGEMSCVNCSNAIIRAVKKIDGVKEADVNFALGEGIFTYDDKKTSQEAIETKIEKIGYKILKQDSSDNTKIVLIKVLLAFILTLFLHFAHHLNLPHFLTNITVFIAASIVQFGCGGSFYTHSFKALKNKTFDMNVLIALGTSAAYFYSAFVFIAPYLFPENLRFVYFDGAAMIVAFVLFGRYLEARARVKAADFMKELLSLSPKKAILIKDGKKEETALEELKAGDIIEVKSGQNIALDGIVTEGEGEVDTSMINGEPMPKFTKADDKVIGGTTLKLGYLHVRVEKPYQDTMLSQIIKLLKDAENKKIPIARLADKAASIFVPLVITIAIITFLVWSAIGDMQMAVLSSISVLIISCPCALGLATPIAIVAGVGAGAKEGIFIKNPEVLEIISKIKFAVFDKTGTLTKGDVKVFESTISDKKLLGIFASLEVKSEHPISRAIVDFAKRNKIYENYDIQNLEIKPGFGLIGTCEGKMAAVGTLKLMNLLNININDDIKQIYENGLNEGKTTVLASFDSKIAGVFYLEDEKKTGAKELVAYLKSKNIEPIILTGDKKAPSLHLAEQIGVENIISEVLPQEKFEKIKLLQKEGFVLFTGDGINDSLSIKQADIGIAMNSGSDIAKNSGDIIIINNELGSVKKSIELSAATLRVIKQNLFWAFIYNIIGIPLAGGVLYFADVTLTPAIAGAAMSISSVTVVLNSLRLRMKKFG
ncbi:MAG: heavy metal translocating P-type ATPase [Campylobacteraceae bacterium]|jgi:Cu+-exporting ATPase|nr:heavy metal translocating P-type ATPase [Campylobacteraceae bacterium]